MRVLDFRLYSEMREPDPKANHKRENIFFVANAGSEVQSLQFAIGVCVGEASSHIIHLASLFGAFPESQKRLVITRYLASPSTRARALGLLAMTGTKERAGRVLPLLEREMSGGESIEAGVQQAAVGALSHIGDCSTPSRVKALLGNPGATLGPPCRSYFTYGTAVCLPSRTFWGQCCSDQQEGRLAPTRCSR
jgi:hypothetical protein